MTRLLKCRRFSRKSGNTELTELQCYLLKGIIKEQGRLIKSPLLWFTEHLQLLRVVAHPFLIVGVLARLKDGALAGEWRCAGVRLLGARKQLADE